MRRLRVRGLKTYAAARNDAIKSKFLPPWMIHHLFGNNPNHNDRKPPTLNISSSGDGYLHSGVEATRMPALYGTSIQSHIQNISESRYGVYRNLLKELSSSSCPAIPDSWVFQPGWTCYREGCEPEHVDFPEEDALIFDVEVCVQESFAPVLATAVSPSAWYSWVSPSLTHRVDHKKKHVCISDLVPLGNQGQRPRVVIGHYVCFDSARIQECYDLPMSGLKCFDTMAAHISVSGVSDLQRYFILKAAKKPDWAAMACGNSLSALHLLYCEKELDKTERDVFVKGSLDDIAERFQELCTYCALDVKATHSVYSTLLPMFLERFPHGATLGAMLEMSSMFVPVSGDFEQIVESIEEKSAAEDREVKLLFQELANDSLKLMQDEKYKEDPWMWDQDWSVSQRKKKQDGSISAYPEWYRKLISQIDNQSSDALGIHINYRRNISAKLMQLCWGSYPLHFEPNRGWGMLMPGLKATDVTDRNVPVKSVKKLCKSLFPRPRVSSVPSLRDYISLQSGITASNSRISSGQHGFKSEKEDNFTQFFIQNGVLFKKLPHHMSMMKNVGGALSLHLLSNQCLRTGNENAQKILNILRKNVFWKKSGKSFATLPVVWLNKELSMGAVVPSASACGDYNRQPREIIFSSLCNEVSGSTGTEVGEAFKAPPDWCFLSANFPQADLWMVSLLADSEYGEYCASAIGRMFVEGTLYKSIAERMQLSEDQSALLFHAVIWGASRRFLAKVLREINPVLGDATAYEKAEILLEGLCGNHNIPGANSNSGGTLAGFFNKLGKVASSKAISTPILHSRLSRVLEKDTQKFSSLIQHWLVRSSVADYLHVLMLCFHDLLPSARLCTVSSDNLLIKYLVPENEKYHAAKSLHVAHLYAAAFCASQVGLSDVPKIAAELPSVRLSPTIRDDASKDCQNLSFQEAVEFSKNQQIKEN